MGGVVGAEVPLLLLLPSLHLQEGERAIRQLGPDQYCGLQNMKGRPSSRKPGHLHTAGDNPAATEDVVNTSKTPSLGLDLNNNCHLPIQQQQQGEEKIHSPADTSQRAQGFPGCLVK